MQWLDLLRGGALLCVVGPLVACGSGDASPGSGSNGSTSGSGPTTFATFSTTAPMTTMPATLTAADETTTSDGTDADDSSGTSVDTEGDSSSTEAGPTLCPETHMCMPEAPREWSGPALLTEHPIADPKAKPEPPPECGDDYPMRDGAGFGDLQAEPASCGCECAPSIASECETSTTLRYWSDDATCDDGVPQAINVFAGACNTLPDDFPGNEFYSAAPVQAVGGACQPTTSESVDPAFWGLQLSLCGDPELLEGCAEGRVCAPQADEGQLCVWREGEHECPDGFDVPRAMYDDIDDDRGCATCSCGSPEGLCDSAAVRLWNGTTCLTPSAGSIPANAECNNSNSGTVARTASLSLGQPTAFCAPSAPMPDGEAVGTGTTTICCLE